MMKTDTFKTFMTEYQINHGFREGKSLKLINGGNF